MQIEKAYLFARQITEGEVPQPMEPDVYFENGRFNPLYVPPNFNYKTHTIVIDEQQFDDSGYQDHVFNEGELEDGYTIIYTNGDSNLYNPQEKFSIEDGVIKFRHSRPQITGQVIHGWHNAILFPLGDFWTLATGKKRIRYRAKLTVDDWSIDDKNSYVISVEINRAINTPPTKIYKTLWDSSIYMTNSINTSGFDWTNKELRLTGSFNYPLAYFVIDVWPNDNNYREQTGYGGVDFTIEISKIWVS